MNQGELGLDSSPLLKEILGSEPIVVAHFSEAQSVEASGFTVRWGLGKHVALIHRIERRNAEPIAQLIADSRNNLEQLVCTADLGDLGEDLARLGILHTNIEA